MSDPLRTNPTNQTPASIDGDAERDAKIETLLIAGLDQYFAAHYAQAMAGGIPYTATVPFTGTATRVKVLVYDYPADRLGTVNLRLK